MTSDNFDPELLAEVRSIHQDASDARVQLERIENSRQQDRRILNRIQLLLFAKLLTLLLLVFTIIGLFNAVHLQQKSNRLIQDCTTPSGVCYQRNAALQGQLVLSISYQTQAQQLETSVRVASATGNTAAIPVYQTRRQETADVLRQITENIVDINDGKLPRHVIPTELPIAGNGK